VTAAAASTIIDGISSHGELAVDELRPVGDTGTDDRIVEIIILVVQRLPTSMPKARNLSATKAEVSCSLKPSSGIEWRWRRHSVALST
jgi:hypothetical protein